MTGVVGHEGSRGVELVVGVDTHQDEHVAVAIDRQGVRLGELHTVATTHGYEELERWSRGLGEIHAFGIEGTGSYGAGVARFLTSRDYNVVEVNRPDRSTRYRKGKSDPTDAEMAARAVLAGVADATPKSGEGEVEMIRMLKSAKDSAVKARTQAINQMNGPGAGCHGPGRASRNARWSLCRCSSHALQELPYRSSGRSPSSGQVHPALPCPPLPSAQRGGPRPRGRARSTHPDGSPSLGRSLRHRTRHGGDPPHCCGE